MPRTLNSFASLHFTELHLYLFSTELSYRRIYFFRLPVFLLHSIVCVAIFGRRTIYGTAKSRSVHCSLSLNEMLCKQVQVPEQACNLLEEEFVANVQCKQLLAFLNRPRSSGAEEAIRSAFHQIDLNTPQVASSFSFRKYRQFPQSEKSIV